MMTLYDFASIAEGYFTTSDATLDAVVEFSVFGMMDEFSAELFQKVQVVKICDRGIIVGWSNFIFDNLDKFKAFSAQHWTCPVEEDEAEFAYQWLGELQNLLAGQATEDFYSVLVDFLQTL